MSVEELKIGVRSCFNDMVRPEILPHPVWITSDPTVGSCWKKLAICPNSEYLKEEPSLLWLCQHYQVLTLSQILLDAGSIAVNETDTVLALMGLNI